MGKLILGFLVAAMTFTLHADPLIDLSTVSNETLLNEVGRRMENTPQKPIARASYVCDSAGYLYIKLTSPTGQNTEKNLHSYNYDQCLSQSLLLNKNKTRIYQVTNVYVCDASGYLYLYPLKPDGTFGTQTNHHTGSFANCLTQAKQLNANP